MMVETHHKEFIDSQMKELAAYDALRPKGHVYEFHHHSERVARLMRNFASQLGMDDDMAETLYWATLPHDIGKKKLDVDIWDTKDAPTAEQKQLRRTHTQHGVAIVQNHFGEEECQSSPFLKMMLDIMENHHETMDGQGFLGKTGEELSREVRMACICDAFDGWSVRRPSFDENRDLSPSGVLHRMEFEKQGQFDPTLLKTFKETVLCLSKSSLSPILCF